MTKLKIPLLIIVTLGLLLGFAMLPKFVSYVLDQQLEKIPSYRDMLTIQLDLTGDQSTLTTTDKLALLGRAEAVNINQDQMTMREDEVHEAVSAFLLQLESAGIFQGFEPTTFAMQPKLLYNLSDSSQRIFIWTVSFTSKNEPNQALLLDIDDETGQILCVSYNIYQTYVMDDVWARNKVVMDHFTDIYFAQLGLSEVAEGIESSEVDGATFDSTFLYEYKEVDGGVTEVIYAFESPLFGQFHVQFTVYQVYSGIQIIYNDFEATSCEWAGQHDENILEINHCREGREGSRLLSGSCLYLGEGDLSIHTMDNCAPEMSFPLKHYRGISVVINLKAVAENPPEILSESGIDILGFKEKFCAGGNCFIMRTKDDIEHIFSELYSVPDCLQKPYFRLKVQELLLFLSMIDVSKEQQREQYTAPQVEIVKKIHRKLISDLQKRPTIEELSKEFLINTVTLKNTFKGIYGQPIGTYMKEYRIKQAAILLRQTNVTIAEIAGQIGYENQSKFANAFRDIMMVSPAEYRKQNVGKV